MVEIKLPELGENIDVVDISAVLVAVGDIVRRDQPVIEVETEKASLEVPSPAEGRVDELLVKAGDQIKVGQLIARIASEKDAAAAPPAEEPAAKPAAKPEAAAPAVPPEAANTQPPSLVPFRPAVTQQRAPIGPTVPAAPSVRALARELGVEIGTVRGSGPGGRLSHSDVKKHAKSIILGSSSRPPSAAATPPLPEFSRWGEVRREPLNKVRRATAAAMNSSWSTIPHVTQFDHADITQLESMRKSFNGRPEVGRGKLSMTGIVVKIAAAALKRFPKFNASLDPERDSVVLKDYVHIAVAVDTERGLLVPVVRDVERKKLVEVSVEVADLAARAREKKITPDEMRGACFTVSNLGGLGTTHFSPIVNWPEVAILGVGRAENRAVYEDGQFRPRLILPLSLSYDHRWIDGADAARFLRWLAEALEQPLLLLMEPDAP